MLQLFLSGSDTVGFLKTFGIKPKLWSGQPQIQRHHEAIKQCHYFTVVGTTAADQLRNSIKSAAAYSGDIIVRTETGIDAPDIAVLAEQLCVEIRVHLDQKTSPAELSLQVQSVGRPFTIKSTALYEKSIVLQIQTIVITLWCQHQISAHDMRFIYSAPKLYCITHISCHSFTETKDVLIKYNCSYLSKTQRMRFCLCVLKCHCALPQQYSNAVPCWEQPSNGRPRRSLLPSPFISYDNSGDHIHSMINLRWPHISICHVMNVEQSVHVHSDWIFNY